MFRVPVELQALVDIYEQPFFIIDDNHRVVVANRAFQATYEVDTTQATGTPCHLLLASQHGPRPCGSQGAACPFAETFARQVTRAAAFSYRDRGGREHLVRTQAYPLRTESGQVYVGVLLQRTGYREDTSIASPDATRPMVGTSPAFRAALGRLEAAAKTSAPVLIYGETGTGKELAADFVHRSSNRGSDTFQTLDCSVLTDDLFENEVFGHERGAFTGSAGEKRGLFELADGGTLFLDEIGEALARDPGQAPARARDRRVPTRGRSDDPPRGCPPPVRHQPRPARRTLVSQRSLLPHRLRLHPTPEPL